VGVPDGHAESWNAELAVSIERDRPCGSSSNDHPGRTGHSEHGMSKLHGIVSSLVIDIGLDDQVRMAANGIGHCWGGGRTSEVDYRRYLRRPSSPDHAERRYLDERVAVDVGERGVGQW
jgi:hypothetical protein